VNILYEYNSAWLALQFTRPSVSDPDPFHFRLPDPTL